MPERRPPRRALSVLLVTGVAALSSAAPAWAGDPIMALSDVHRGMSCTGYSVFSGTDIQGFGASVVDVVAGDSAAQAPAILIRVHGPPIDATGAGNGFSGSPIYCPDQHGLPRIIGAISQGIGQYGNTEVLATPIESILGQPVPAPAAARRDHALRSRARPLAEPVTVSGLSPGVAGYFSRIAARTGRTLYFAPSHSFSSFPAQTLRPGSAVAVGLASGDISAGAIGTVAYTDANRVWAFGHPLDSAGRRSLLLEDAYVYDVINNPLNLGDATTFKLAAPGHDLGTITGDGASAVTGVLGRLPPRIALRVRGGRPDTGGRVAVNAAVADETDLGLPNGSSALSLVAPMAISEAATSLLGGTPVRHSGSLCLVIHLRERPRPMGFCNTYVAASGAPSGVLDTTMVSDVGQATGALDAFDAVALHVTGVEGDLEFVPGVRAARLLSARALGRARRGARLRVSVLLARPRGPRFTRTIVVAIPRAARPGRHEITLSGTPPDSAPTTATSAVGPGGPTAPGASGSSAPADGPSTIAGLAREIADIQRFDGISATLHDGRRRAARPAYRDPRLRIGGSVSFTVLVPR